jgi:branched-chain amino acid transport system substrate-binding protein
MAHPRFTRRGLLRVSILGAAAGAAGVLLSACGGAATPTPAPAAPAAAPTNTPAPAPAAAAPTNTPAPAAAPAAAPTATTAPAAAAPAASTYPASIEIGVNLPFTGADAADAANIRDGALLAFDDVNAQGGAGGKIKLTPLVKDDGTVAAGQYDPAQAATNTKQFVADNNVFGIVGPQMSGSGKAMSPIASAADLMIITPSSTNPDITDPKFASQYRPNGKAIYFRTVTTDAFQGPYMANFAAETLNVKTIYILDDTGAYGDGIAKAFETQAKAKGINVLGHDKVDPKESDYTTVMTKIKGLNPDALYYGGVQQAGVKVAKQSYDAFPKIPKLAGDGMYSDSLAKDAGPAAEGWYASIAGPDTIEQAEAKDWVAKYKAKYNHDPLNYAITAYDAVLVIADAIGRLVKDGKDLTRANVRDYALKSELKTLQGTIAFDENGDIKDRIVSIFQLKDGKYVFVGAAPQT